MSSTSFITRVSSMSLVLLLLFGSDASGIGTAVVRASPEFLCNADNTAACSSKTVATEVHKSFAREDATLPTKPDGAEASDQRHKSSSETEVKFPSSLTEDEVVRHDPLREDIAEAPQGTDISLKEGRRGNHLPEAAADTADNALQRTTVTTDSIDQLPQKEGQNDLKLISGIIHNTTSDDRDPLQGLPMVAHDPRPLGLVSSTSESSRGEHSRDDGHLESPAFTNNFRRPAFRNGRKLLLYDPLVQRADSTLQSGSHVHTDPTLEPERQENTPASGSPEATLVRKCCSQDQFINLETKQCEAAAAGDRGFRESVLALLPENASRVLQYGSGPCPGTGTFSSIREAKFDSHSLLAFGRPEGHTPGIYYDHDHYCLEMAASGLDQTASAALVTAYCRPRPSDTLTRKCCRPNEYFDTAVRDCRSMSANTSGDRGSPVHEFLRDGARTAPIHVSTGKLTCGCGSPKSVSADEAFLGAADQLCDQKTGYCYSTSRYCLEYVWEEGVTSMTAIALVCPLDFFQKCCPRDYVLTDSGCALAAWGDVTARMVQLMELMEPQFWHPTDIGGQECVQEWITLDDASTHWWVNRSGCLSVDTELGSLTASSYCVDNYVSPASETQTGAFVCHKEQKSIKYPSAQHDAEGSVGKCCPHDSYMRMDDFSCVPDDLGLTLLENPILQTANVTRLTYNSFPTCENDFGYHYYFLDPDSQEDHAELVANQGIEVVSVEGKCILNRQPFLRKDYCLESAVTGGENRPMILVCAKTVATGITHTEKFGLTAALLGVSCVALFATTFFLVSSRLRRSSVSVNKVHTSMDWILLTYVVACLIAFLLLAVSMLWRISMDAIECQVMAGLLMFSLLGSFFWNTTICLETLLLTLGATTSRGWRRYVYHSLWAWGIPALITFLALTLDHYRENLPCSVITPRIGVYTCFFSDATAKLVYLYLPMLVSVCVNIVLLIAARCIRSAKLRRFGKSCRLGPPVGRDGSEARRPTLQNRFNKDHDYRTSHWRSYNSWTDSMKLVVWSGATWVMEVVGFVVSTYSVEPWESWDSYLWYIPSSINALRGVGIFFILVLTPENCLKLLHAFASLGSPRRDVGRHQNTSSSPGTRDGRGMSHTPRRHALTFHTYVSTATLESEGVEMDAGVEGACETGQSSTRETREGGGPSDISLPHSVPVYNTRSVSEA